MLQFLLRAAALLIERADDAHISERDLAVRSNPLVTDETIYKLNWCERTRVFVHFHNFCVLVLT